MDEPRCIREARIPSGVGEGWYPLIRALERALGAAYPGWRPEQVKQKFGTLRFYAQPPLDLTDEETEDFDTLIGVVELASERVCEVCGRPGALHKDAGLLRIVCTEHR